MPVETATELRSITFCKRHPGSPRAEEAERRARRQHAARPLPDRGSVREPSAVQVRGAGSDRGDPRRRARHRAALPRACRGRARTPSRHAVPRGACARRRPLGPLARLRLGRVAHAHPLAPPVDPVSSCMPRSVDIVKTSKLAPMSADAAPRLDADERLRRYAELAVRVGANVQPGQEVVVLCQVEHAPIGARRRARVLPCRREAGHRPLRAISTSAAPRSSSARRRCSARPREYLLDGSAPGGRRSRR